MKHKNFTPLLETRCFSRFRTAILVQGVTLLSVAGCASYTELHLPEGVPLAPSLAALAGGSSALLPLQVGDVARLAVENSPDLRATRTQRGVAQAQLLQAGLAPNPTMTGSILPLAAGFGTTNAWNAGLSYDIKSLITLRSRRRAAGEQARSVDASLLWAEWQTASQAQLLTVDVMMGERALAVLQQTRGLVADRAARSSRALAEGNVTLTTTAPDIAALQTARTALFDQERLQLTRRHQLNALLGLRPDAILPLAATPELPPFDPARAAAAVPTLADRRPDLVALRLGYAAQDQKIRTAILSQFPNLSIGVTGGSDNSSVRNVGPQIQLELPIFDHAQGLIAQENATREQLHAEYTARLAAATGQVGALLAEMELQRRQLAVVRHDLAGIERTAAAAQSALRAGNLDERSALDLIVARATKQLEIIGLEQALLDQQVAIGTLVGAGMPTVDPAPPP